MESVKATIVAALGALYNKASSPNESPDSYFFKNVFVPFITLVQFNDPSSIKYKQSP